MNPYPFRYKSKASFIDSIKMRVKFHLLSLTLILFIFFSTLPGSIEKLIKMRDQKLFTDRNCTERVRVKT